MHFCGDELLALTAATPFVGVAWLWVQRTWAGITGRRQMYRCPECESTDVIRTQWYYLNGGERVDTSDPFDHDWCNACDTEINAALTERHEK